MFSCRHDGDSERVVTFYVVYTSIYFPTILLALYWSGGIYTVGKYSFKSVLIIIVFAEVIKYFATVIRFKKYDLSLMKKHDDLTRYNFVRSLFDRSRLKEGCRNVLTVVIMMAVYFIISVLYGAEIFSKHEETVMFSALLSVLTILPICVNLGSPYVMSFLSGFRPNDKLEQLMFQNLYITWFGAWLGAFVIPLDWDRPWQQWPVSCSCGAMAGFLVSHFVMVLHKSYTTTRRKIRC